MKKRREYTDEFRQQAIQLSIELGSPTKAAEQLGIHRTLITQWKKKSPGSTSIDGQQSSEEELKRLRREVSELKKVNHILKAAAAFFSQDHLK